MKRKATQSKSATNKKAKVELRVETPEEIPHAQVTVTDHPHLQVQVLGFGGGESSQLTNQHPSEKKYPAPLEQFKDVTVLDVWLR